MNKRNSFLPYALPNFTENEIIKVVETLNSLWWSKGSKCEKFENEFKDYVGAKYALSLNSCTSALHISLATCGIENGDEVITTPLTFCSTSNTIIHQGAIPVFCDIDDTTGLIDENKIEALITEKTKAILPVHYSGQACDIDKIMSIANKYKLKVIDDAAHASATKYKGKMVGGLCDATSFSFYATKNIATGEGGMLTTNDEEIYERARVISLHGMNKNAYNRYKAGGSHEYDVTFPGYKYNMNDIAASLGIAQLEQIELMQNTRKKYAEIYMKELSTINGVMPLKQLDYCENAWHLFVVKIDENILSIDRNTFISELSELNIGTSVHFRPVHTFTFYRENYPQKEGTLSKAEDFYKKIISLPLYPSMTEEDVYYVMESVREIACRYAK